MGGKAIGMTPNRKTRRFLGPLIYVILLISVCIGVLGLAILIFAEISVRYSEKSDLNSIIYYSAPILLFLIIYFNLIRVFKFENLKN